MEEYLNSDEENVVAIHCKAGKGRTGMMISSFLMYFKLATSADEAMCLFEMERTHDWKGVTIPSQRRYVHYYEGILHSADPRQVPIQIYHVTQLRVLHWPSKHMTSNLQYDIRVMIHEKLSEWSEYRVAGGKCLDTMYNPVSQCLALPCSDELIVRGDVKITFNTGSTRLLSAWFHTGFVYRSSLRFDKSDLDKVCKDTKHKKFPATLAMEIMFEPAEEDAQLVDTFVCTELEQQAVMSGTEDSSDYSNDESDDNEEEEDNETM